MNTDPMSPQLQTFDHLAAAITLNSLDLQLLVRDWQDRKAWTPVILDKTRRAKEMIEAALGAIEEVEVALSNRVLIPIREAAE